ncbi:hypothetical protein CR513_20846, partial [Mucuna pruriens]
MYQGSKSIEECYNDMEVALMRANRRCLASKRTYPNGSSSWKGKETKKEQPRKDKSLKKGNSPSLG